MSKTGKSETESRLVIARGWVGMEVGERGEEGLEVTAKGCGVYLGGNKNVLKGIVIVA